MTVSIRLNERDSELFKKYAEINNLTLSELFRQSVMEKIEDEYDLQLYNEAMAEHETDPKTYTHDEVKKMLELE